MKHEASSINFSKQRDITFVRIHFPGIREKNLFILCERLFPRMRDSFSFDHGTSKAELEDFAHHGLLSSIRFKYVINILAKKCKCVSMQESAQNRRALKDLVIGIPLFRKINGC